MEKRPVDRTKVGKKAEKKLQKKTCACLQTKCFCKLTKLKRNDKGRFVIEPQ